MRLPGDLLSLNVWAAALTDIFPAPYTGNIVDLGYARYRGNLSYPNAVAYLGIPYAEPPIGERRFRAPLRLNTTRVELEAGGEVVEASKYPAFCVQGTSHVGDAGGAGSEDCLNVNVYAPAGAKEGDDLPVFVHVHGGGYVTGNPRNWPFDHWIHQSPDVVIVSVYYRLGPFGFLSTLSAALDLNAGFLDQVMALQWVQEHISAFGGDPHRVTLGGESAGASAVELHLVSNVSVGLFSQAILQSVHRTPVPLPEQQMLLFDYFAQRANCGAPRVSTEVRIDCLRKAPVSALARAQDSAAYNFMEPYKIFTPVVDGQNITRSPTVAMEEGNIVDVPVLVGSPSNHTLSKYETEREIDQALHAFFPALSPRELAAYDYYYVPADYASDKERFTFATGESELVCARNIIANAILRRDKPVFVYGYDRTMPPTSGKGTLGHAAESWMMFRGARSGVNGTVTFEPQDPDEAAFARELIAYWLSFVKKGDPNVERLDGSPEWPAYSERSPARLALRQGKSELETESGKERKRCRFVTRLARGHQA